MKADFICGDAKKQKIFFSFQGSIPNLKLKCLKETNWMEINFDQGNTNILGHQSVLRIHAKRSQKWHWRFRPDDALLWMPVPCTGGRLVASLALAHRCQEQPPPQKSWQPEMSLDIIKCPLGVKGLGEAKLPQLRITSKYISILYFQWGLLTIPVCPELRGFSGCESFRSKTRWVPGNLFQLVTLTGLFWSAGCWKCMKYTDIEEVHTWRNTL